MGVLKRGAFVVLVLSFAIFTSGDRETSNPNEAKSKEETSAKTTETVEAETKSKKIVQPPKKESTTSEGKRLDRLKLDEEIEGDANISLPQDI